MGKRTRFQKKETAQLVCMIAPVGTQDAHAPSQAQQPAGDDGAPLAEQSNKTAELQTAEEVVRARSHLLAEANGGQVPTGFLPTNHPLDSDVLLEELSLVGFERSHHCCVVSGL